MRFRPSLPWVPNESKLRRAQIEAGTFSRGSARRLATALARDVDIVVLPARRQELRETLSREAIAAF